MAAYTLTINHPKADEVAAHIQDAVNYADNDNLLELLKAMRGKDGKSHNSMLKKALSLKNFL